MSSIDNRIVKMAFENAQFTKAANATMDTLRKLSDSLKLSEGTKGLDNLANKAKSVDMSSLASSVDHVSSRLSAMDIIGVTALVNIANSAVNAGKNLLSSLTIDPIMSGFNEYETKMQSIQTIMTNTAHAGTTMEDVTAALDDLNVYADKTIYNFAEMTRNIGTFTAAGVGLEDAKTAIKGIANLAAGSGSTSQQASTAMYQLSQALASGVVNLQDWNSVVNAGMGGKLFQDALKETGKSMGAIIDDTQTFRESISSKDGTGWLTSDILLATLQKFADDPALLEAATQVKTFTALIDTMKESVQSGWSQSWEYIIGNKMEAAEFFTAISQGFESIAGPMAEYRNEALKYWNEAGGRESVIKGLANIMKAIGKILGPIYESFKKIIDPWNGERMVSLSQAFEKFTEKLILSDEASAAIGKTFDAIFSVGKALMSLLKPLGAVFGALVTVVSPVIEALIRMIGVVGNWVTSLKDGLDASGALDKAMTWLSESAKKVADILEKVLSGSDELMQKGLDKATEYIGKMAQVFQDVVFAGKEKLIIMTEFVKEFVEVHKPMEKAGEIVQNVFKGMQNGIQGFLDFIKTSAKTIQGFFISIVERIKSLDIQAIDFVNAGLFAGLFVVIKKVRDVIKNFMEGIGDFKSSAIGLLDETRSTLEAYQKNLKADTIQKIAIAIGIMAVSLFLLSKIDPKRLLPAVLAMGALIVGLSHILNTFDGLDLKNVGKMNKSIISLIGISISLGILASAMKKLSKLSPEEMLVSLAGLAAACIVMKEIVQTFDGVNMSPKQGRTMIAMATSMVILGSAMAIIGNLDVSTILKSLGAMAAVMFGMQRFMGSTKEVTNSLKVATSMIPLAIALNILAGALFMFGKMSIGTLIQGFIVLHTALVTIGTFGINMKGVGGDLLKASAGILILSTAMIVLSGALALLGNIDILTLGIGLGVMGASLLIIANTMKLMPKSMIPMATGILILSTGLMTLSLAMRLFGSMKISSILKSIVMLAGTLAALGIGAAFLAPLTPVLAAVALGVGALGIACSVVGGGLLLLSAGITTFAGSIAAAGVGFTGALMAMCAVIPVFTSALALGLVSFITILGYNGPALRRALTQLLDALLQTLIDNTPKFVQAIVVMLSEMMNAVKVLGPQLIDTIVTLVMTILETLSENLPKIVDHVLSFLFELISAILKNVADGIPPIASGFLDIILAIISTFTNNTIKVVNAIWDFVISIINAFADGIETKMPEVRAACKRVVNAIIDEFAGWIGDMIEIGGNIVSGIAKGITNGISNVINAAKNVARGALDAVKNLLDIHSPSREFAKLGMYSSQGMAEGLTDYAGEVGTAAEEVGDSALTGMRSAISSISELLTSDIDAQPVITPVMDLSEIQNGSKSIGDIMKRSGGYALDTSLNMASRASTGFAKMLNSALNPVEPEQAVSNSNTNNFNNTFNITGDNPKDIANQVSRVIQKQVERRDLVWA